MDSKSGSVWAVAIVFTILTWITVPLRIYVRANQLGKFGVDDRLVIIAQIFFTAYLACQIGGVVYGTGRHLAVLDLRDAETALRFWYFCEIWYSLSSTFVKLAICFSLRRVTTKRTHLIIIYALIVWSIALGLSFFLGVIFQCNPTSDWWSLDPNQKRCLPSHIITSLIYTVSASNVACDWTLGIFPFFIVKDLTIPLQQKIMVASILAFGALASTATIVRMFYLHTLDQVYYGRDGDFLCKHFQTLVIPDAHACTDDTAEVAIWTTVEGGVAITAISLATLRPLVSRVLWFLRSNGSASFGRVYASSYATDDSRTHIPLSVNGAPIIGDTLHPDDMLSATQFNRTKPLSNRHGEVRFAKDKTSPPPSILVQGTSFNTTKALTSSQVTLEDDESYKAGSSTVRRHGPT
ncbi:hypothetical protein AMS68_003463 [Peltaster fructicola]|uniref:Rhodopsin domain-containing protein n=1 Tax=Peltaster fructicola TaxID=286661 RepID=A0A6H0XTE8_9PEZI|nr:hypothetical protein AMS68_003463 [Peltaster fructicola]